MRTISSTASSASRPIPTSVLIKTASTRSTSEGRHRAMTFRHVGTTWLLCFILAPLTGSAAEVDLAQLSGKGKPIAAAPLSFSGSSKDYIGVVREDTSREGLPVRRI